MTCTPPACGRMLPPPCPTDLNRTVAAPLRQHARGHAYHIVTSVEDLRRCDDLAAARGSSRTRRPEPPSPDASNSIGSSAWLRSTLSRTPAAASLRQTLRRERLRASRREEPRESAILLRVEITARKCGRKTTKPEVERQAFGSVNCSVVCETARRVFRPGGRAGAGRQGQGGPAPVRTFSTSRRICRSRESGRRSGGTLAASAGPLAGSDSLWPVFPDHLQKALAKPGQTI